MIFPLQNLLKTQLADKGQKEDGLGSGSSSSSSSEEKGKNNNDEGDSDSSEDEEEEEGEDRSETKTDENAGETKDKQPIKSSDGNGKAIIDKKTTNPVFSFLKKPRLDGKRAITITSRLIEEDPKKKSPTNPPPQRRKLNSSTASGIVTERPQKIMKLGNLRMNVDASVDA